MFVYGFEHLPNPYLDEYHKYVSIPIMLTCYWSYYKACSTDPGRLTKDTEKSKLEHSLKRYAYDEMMFSAESWCSTCDIPKPARSKHCSMCNCCIEKYDHHCVWLNSCVGLHNYKYFILFLFMHSVVCIYGIVIGAFCAMHLIDEGELYTKVYFDE